MGKAKNSNVSIQVEKKNRAIAETIEAMINEPYDVTEKRRAEEIQKQAAEILNMERPKGRYRIDESIIVLLAKTGDYYPLAKGVESGEIPCYKHETGDKKGDQNDLRSYVCGSALNTWIKNNSAIKDFRFPTPDKGKDIKTERGCRRQIREHWDKIKLLNGVNADGRQVLSVLKIHVDASELPKKLKTVQNCLIQLRKEKLIP